MSDARPLANSTALRDDTVLRRVRQLGSARDGLREWRLQRWTALALIPLALYMTDFSQPINYGLGGPWLAAVTQILNAVGALTLVYAFRYGKAIVVSPLVNAGAPLMTAVIALAIAGTLPGPYKLAGAILALAGSLLLSLQPE